jgi:hypothetical protein
LAPLVTSLWQKEFSPAHLWPLIMAIVKIASTSDKPKKWFQGLKTPHTLSNTETATLDGADTFTDLFRLLTETEKGDSSSKKVAEVEEAEETVEVESSDKEETDAEPEGKDETPVTTLTDSCEGSPTKKKTTSNSTAALWKKLEVLRARYCKVTGSTMPPKTATEAVLKKGIVALEQALEKQSATGTEGKTGWHL